MCDDRSRGPKDRDAEAYLRMVHFAAESVFDASDEEITEAMLEKGEDPEESAERLRTALLDVARRYRERKGR